MGLLAIRFCAVVCKLNDEDLIDWDVQSEKGAKTMAYPERSKADDQTFTRISKTL